MKNKIAVILAFAFLCAHAFAETFEFAIIGDAGRVNEKSMIVRNSIHQMGIRRTILPGDNLYETKKGYAQAWDPWTAMGFTFDVVAIGNHNAGYAKEKAFFNMPNDYYVKTIGTDIKFIVLNSDNQWLPRTQAKWFDRQMKATTEKFVFVVYHHPSLSLQHQWKDRKTFGEKIRPLLFKHRAKITALLVGHDHLAAMYHFNDLPVVLSGAVQDTRQNTPTNNVQEGIAVRTDYMYDRSPFWVRLSVNKNESAAKFDFIRASDSQTTYSTCVITGKEASPATCSL